MNILVATPGRLLQHMDQTIGFDAENLQMLVLDEADRILDMGFQASVNAIVGHLPESRQTLLFSATQTKSVKDLARLSLQDPEYVWVQQPGPTASTSAGGNPDSDQVDLPSNLSQHYTVVPLDQKMDRLWSFIKTHLFHKTIVFLSSCKQVRFVFEAFRQLRPGVPLMHLHGKQKQMQRLEIYNRFVESENAVLFATDIAARGLDFPNVGWVVQLDCPEDVDTYVHRVGRTARYQSKGKALLFLLPSEEAGMQRRFQSKGLKVEPIKLRDSKQQTVHRQLQSLAFKSAEVKFLAQRVCSSSFFCIRKNPDLALDDAGIHLIRSIHPPSERQGCLQARWSPVGGLCRIVGFGWCTTNQIHEQRCCFKQEERCASCSERRSCCRWRGFQLQR